MDHQVVHYFPMTRISVTDAKSQLTDLVRRAEAGEEIVLTRHDRPVVALTRLNPELAPDELREKRRRALDRLLAASFKVIPGPDAAHAADFLYDENGMPK
jgi:prevent-host-death family protein